MAGGGGRAGDAAAAARVADLQKLVTEVRRFRTEQGLPGQPQVAARVAGVGSADPRPRCASLARLAAAGRRVRADGHRRGRSLRRPVHVELDTSGAIDVAAERARLGRDLAAAQKELDAAEKKLGNPKFVEKAPAAGRRRDPGARGRPPLADVERVTRGDGSRRPLSRLGSATPGSTRVTGPSVTAG